MNISLMVSAYYAYNAAGNECIPFAQVAQADPFIAALDNLDIEVIDITYRPHKCSAAVRHEGETHFLKYEYTIPKSYYEYTGGATGYQEYALADIEGRFGE